MGDITRMLDAHFGLQTTAFDQQLSRKLQFCRPLATEEEALAIECVSLRGQELETAEHIHESVASEALSFLKALADIAKSLCTRTFEVHGRLGCLLKC